MGYEQAGKMLFKNMYIFFGHANSITDPVPKHFRSIVR